MNQFPLIQVSGSAFEMGFQHGRQAAPLIRNYLRWIEKLTGVGGAELRTNAMNFVPFIEQLSAPYMEEVRGLADGARISLDEAVLCQARAEAAHRFDGGCSAFALTRSATAGGAPLAGQNQDLESEYADFGIVLHVKPNDGRPRALMFTFAGQLGYAGMNEFGVSNFVNALYNFRWQPGVPYYPLRRAILEQRTVADCIRVLRKYPACSAANLVLADGAGDIADVECRPEGRVECDYSSPDGRLHTNHYLTPDFSHYEAGTLTDSVPRLARMQALVEKSWGRITVATMKEILADHQGDSAGICRHGAVQMHSICGYIAEPARGVLHVRRGHGCIGTWTAYQV